MNPTLTRAAGRLQLALWPESRAALRMPFVLDPPAPDAFAAFGSNSWIVPPARIIGAEHIDFGTEVVALEHLELRAVPATGADARRPLVHIGDGSRLARFVTIWATVGVHIGARVSTSDHVAIADCWSQPNARHQGIHGIPAPDPAAVVIQEGAYLGCGSFIGPGVTVGRGAFVGEGAVVLSDVPAHAVVYGNPAAVTRQWSPTDGWQA
jgi:acetyltransferase-like isoleucine patch superfamily enzyme